MAHADFLDETLIPNSHVWGFGRAIIQKTFQLLHTRVHTNPLPTLAQDIGDTFTDGGTFVDLYCEIGMCITFAKLNYDYYHYYHYHYYYY